METIITTTIRETLGALPADRAERDRLLRRAAELCAARAAVSALERAARNADASSVLGDVLRTANTIGEDGADVAAARETLRRTIASSAFSEALPGWIAELRSIAASAPGSGACTVASAMQLWNWTTQHFVHRTDTPALVGSELAEAFAALVAARCHVVGTVRSGEPSSVPQQLLLDLCHMHAARTAASIGALCAELVHGYRRHPAWDAEGCASCYGAEELDELEGLMPGFASTARAQSDVIEADGSHPAKAGPCVRFNQIEGFTRLRAKLDGCLTGARLAGDRAAAALAEPLTASGRK
ncbi:MAG: hypothetical protein ACM36C_02545 [Acidobacteriota bacterium]